MEAMEYKDFGDFLHQKRMNKKVTYRDLADVLGVTPPYISDIEKGRRNAPTKEILNKIISYFELDEDEKSLMMDLAGKTSNTLPRIFPSML